MDEQVDASKRRASTSMRAGLLKRLQELLTASVGDGMMRSEATAGSDSAVQDSTEDVRQALQASILMCVLSLSGSDPAVVSNFGTCAGIFSIILPLCW